MPLYEYRCEACGQRFEVIQKFSDPNADICTKCGKGPVERLISSPAIQFKGTGWYITDYAQKGKTDSATTPSGSTSDKSDGKSDGKSDRKSDTNSGSDSGTKTESTPAATTPTKSE
jgi:putative FmdB family regulatory protein